MAEALYPFYTSAANLPTHHLPSNSAPYDRHSSALPSSQADELVIMGEPIDLSGDGGVLKTIIRQASHDAVAPSESHPLLDGMLK
ncbi:hypothetical protein OROMI_006994 [Orobanche minor]